MRLCTSSYYDLDNLARPHTIVISLNFFHVSVSTFWGAFCLFYFFLSGVLLIYHPIFKLVYKSSSVLIKEKALFFGLCILFDIHSHSTQHRSTIVLIFQKNSGETPPIKWSLSDRAYKYFNSIQSDLKADALGDTTTKSFALFLSSN